LGKTATLSSQTGRGACGKSKDLAKKQTLACSLRLKVAHHSSAIMPRVEDNVKKYPEGGTRTMEDRNREIIVKLRLNKAEHQLLTKAAEVKGRTLQLIVRICIHNEAHKLAK
jgi:hypothetical protein